MKKNRTLHYWLWKWHLIAGLISLPFIILLSVTGTVYLFKEAYEEPLYRPIREVVPQQHSISYQAQWELANENAIKKPTAMIIPTSPREATAFESGKFGGKSTLYIDPYTATVSGELLSKDSLMHRIRKLHGELLLGTYGTKLVELIASWMVVLILTGLYIWWPVRGKGVKGLFLVRTKEGKRTLFRDLHAVTGFWFSLLLLMVLAGGLPWTDVFGANFAKLQEITNTGYPTSWNGNGLYSKEKPQPMDLDKMVSLAKGLRLEGTTAISLPQGKNGIFSVSNTSVDQSTQKMVHFDQYTGEQLMRYDWEDVGFLMRARMWAMAFHQGEFGPWNWLLMFFTGLALTLMCVAAIISYFIRKRKGDWGLPKVPQTYAIGYGVRAAIVFLGLALPLFGASLLAIWVYEKGSIIKK